MCLAVAGQRFGLCAEGSWEAVGMRGLSVVVEICKANRNTPCLYCSSWNSCPNSTSHNSSSCYTLHASVQAVRHSSFVPRLKVWTFKTKMQHPAPGAPTRPTFPIPLSLTVGFLSLKLCCLCIGFKGCTCSLWNSPGPVSQ